MDTWDYNTLGIILRYYTDGSGSNLILHVGTHQDSSAAAHQAKSTGHNGIRMDIQHDPKPIPTGTPSSIGSDNSVSDKATGDGVILLRSAPTPSSAYVSSGYQVTAGINIKTGAYYGDR